MELIDENLVGLIVKFLDPISRIKFGLTARKYHDTFTVESTKFKKIKDVAEDCLVLANATCFAENAFGPEYYKIALKFYLS